MVVLAPAIRGLGLVLAADKASLDASLGILTATSALLATKWATKSLVVVAKEADGAPTDATEWEAHPLIKVFFIDIPPCCSPTIHATAPACAAQEYVVGV